jgi:hypothetical protein
VTGGGLTICFRVRRAVPIEPPRTGQGVEGGRIHPYKAALVEGATGGCKHGVNGERELARSGRVLEAAAGDVAHRATASGHSGTAGAGRDGSAASGANLGGAGSIVGHGGASGARGH